MESKVSISQEEHWLDPRCTVLPIDKLGPFVELSDGNLMTIEGNATHQSKDDGRTWSEACTISQEPPPGRPSGGGQFLKTHDGVYVYVYMDMETFKWEWDESHSEAAEDVRLDVWAIRSLDEGRTWIDRQRIFEGYCGALINIIQTKSGHIVVPVQRLIRNPSRHGMCTYVSADNGKTWERSNIIDLGGHGHHDGAMEAIVVELQDGRLLMLLRTNWDYFWEAYSSDHGLSWRVIKSGDIDASSAPGYLTRLVSGRLVLVWNRLYPQGKSDYPRRGGDCNLSQDKASWQREELSIAFSEDDGKTWTEPAVFACDKGGLSYPYIFERREGELWITTWFQGKLRVSLREADFVGK
ncbi:exo-alpha-sialidase [bacterium]|nr:exo-alpha-sialidase [bacterium]